PPYPSVVVTRCWVFGTESLTHEVGGQTLGDRVGGLLTPLGVFQQCRVHGVAHVCRLEEDLGNRGQGEPAQVGALVQTVVGQVVRDRDVGHLQILAVDVLGQDLGGFDDLLGEPRNLAGHDHVKPTPTLRATVGVYGQSG